MRVGDKGEKLPKYLLFITIVILSFSQGLKEILFGIPIVHLGNLFCVVLFAWALATKGPKRILEQDLKPFVIWITAFTLIGTVGAIIFTPGLVTYLWGLRTYFRMFLLLFDCVMILEKEDMDLLFMGFNVAIVIHFIATLIEFFFFNIRWDYLNGIFGVKMADSSSLHALLLINSCVILYKLYKREMPVLLFLVHMAWMTCNAAMSEIRAWFFEIVALFLIYLVASFDLKRTIILIPVLVAMAAVAIVVMGKMYPYTDHFFGPSGFWSIMGEAHDATNYHAIGRKDQIGAMTGPILDFAKEKTGAANKLAIVTGLGLGSADYSTKSWLQSDFYLKNERLGYASFLLCFLYIETGIAGVIVFSSMWIYLLVIGIAGMKKKHPEAFLMVLTAIAFLITTLYNQTLRTNYGYIMWIFLGTVIVLNRSKEDEKIIV
ncbi:hypothetical protein [Butyrivibrio sp. AE2032]|uniref:hypothetical protein n=1 Tax=Butyrivibrio sp. AE2032 TaxID=1458463 RepID=UPI0016398AF6|nr:hypothetical protein [Butyrivibrio sp. AE2032]